jgi:hypothetical protein
VGFEDDDEDENDDEEIVESRWADGRPYCETTGLALGGVWLFSLSVTRMNTWHKLALTLVATITWAAGSFTAVAASAKWEPQKGETIVVLGNTFGERMEMFGYFESALHAQFPNHNLRMRSMAWSADEISLQPRPYLFGDLKTKLSLPKANVDPKEVWFNGVGADALILCFGMNESFKGEAGLAKFRTDLDAYLKDHLAQKYNGKTAPRLLLVSPIAHENLGKPLPDGVQRNKDLAKYVKTMSEVAAANGVPFIDLFNAHLEWMKKNPKEKLTFNGIHQSEYGDWVFSQWMAQQLGWFDGKVATTGVKEAEAFRDLVAFKNDRFWIHFRAVNGEYIYGRRRQIWAQKVPMITDAEMLRLWEVDEDADKLVFQAKKPQVAQVWAEKPVGK